MKIVFWIIAFLLTLTAICSCRSVETIVTYKTDSIYISKLRTDTLICRDSVIIEKMGDTIRERTTKYIYDKTIVTDTLLKTDSVPVPYPVEKKLSRWEQTKVNYGGYALLFCFIGIAAAIVWLIHKIRNK
jgi:hypothetical protein